jgi:hypothetical protein
LHIVGNYKGVNGSGQGVQIINSATPYIQALGASNINDLQIQAQTIQFQTGTSYSTTERMRLDSSGRLGLGTSSPNKPLHIYTGSSDSEVRLQTNSGTEQNAYLTLRNSGGNLDLYSVNGDIVLNPGNTAAAYFKASGRLGLGTSSPGALLEANGGDIWMVGANGRIYLQNGNTSGGAKIGVRGTSATSNGYLAFETNDVEFARFDSSGRLGIGTTSPEVACDISGQVRASTGVLFGTDTAAANALDDYEEGTFTPTIVGTSTAGTATYAANGQVGRYTKIGNRVFFDLYLSWTAHTGTGDLQINGLPFTVQNTTNLNRNYSAILNVVAMTAGNLGAAFSSPNTTAVALRQMPTGGGSVATIPMDTSAQISISGCFEA